MMGVWKEKFWLFLYLYVDYLIRYTKIYVIFIFLLHRPEDKKSSVCLVLMNRKVESRYRGEYIGSYIAHKKANDSSEVIR